MDEFRLGSISPSDPYREQGSSGSANREKGKRLRKPLSEEETVIKEDDFATSLQQAEAGEEPAEDCYSPSRPADESK